MDVLAGEGKAARTDGLNLFVDVAPELRSSTVWSLAHDGGHGFGIDQEWLAELVGLSSDLAFTGGLWRNAAAVAAQRPAATEMTTELAQRNADLLTANNAIYEAAKSDHPDAFENRGLYPWEQQAILERVQAITSDPEKQKLLALRLTGASVGWGKRSAPQRIVNGG